MQDIGTALAGYLSLLLAYGVRPEDDVSMASCPAWDSLKQIEIIMALEQAFQVSFAPEDIPLLTSQKKLAAKIEELKNASLG